MNFSDIRRWRFSLACLLIVLASYPVRAATNVVTTLADSGPGSLREAIDIAQTNPGPNTITFATNLSGGVIHLTSTNLTITNQSVKITASNLPLGISINGEGTHRVFNVQSDATLRLEFIVITNGGFVGESQVGAGIASSGILSMQSCTIVNNYAYAFGGGLLNRGKAALTNCTFYGNTSGSEGGAIGNQPNQFNVPGELTLMNCTVAANHVVNNGGALFSYSGSVLLNHCTIRNNYASGGGSGGVDVYGGATATFNHCIVAANTADGRATDLYNDGGTFTSEGFNIIGVGVPGFTNGVHGDIVGSAFAPIIVPLGPLQNNGGFTPTMLPLAGSWVIDSGDPSFDGTGLTDQRGRPRVSGSRIDIGACEFSIPRLGALRRVRNGPYQLYEFRLAYPSDGSFSVIATTNIAMPRSQWSNLGLATKISDEEVYDVEIPAVNGPLFFQLRWP